MFEADRQTDGRTDVRTDMTKITVAFRNFSNAPEKIEFVKYKSHTKLSTVQKFLLIIIIINTHYEVNLVIII